MHKQRQSIAGELSFTNDDSLYDEKRDACLYALCNQNCIERPHQQLNIEMQYNRTTAEFLSDLRSFLCLLS